MHVNYSYVSVTVPSLSSVMHVNYSSVSVTVPSLSSAANRATTESPGPEDGSTSYLGLAVGLGVALAVVVLVVVLVDVVVVVWLWRRQWMLPCAGQLYGPLQRRSLIANVLIDCNLQQNEAYSASVESGLCNTPVSPSVRSMEGIYAITEHPHLLRMSPWWSLCTLYLFIACQV